ncbi:FAD binding domain-containing protein [Pseudomassariella vexata]|uniref:FAD binding domain-containing protein n=1 Tax=Pseudomassariella vexata TaxID=1141098 RepID=A0A1Y2DQ90_9PEZI|nr:FAD binding domain-containing protein [Pseudomassariella vexata]ORY60825.1 FAD binding domain-containing protein [Pseudomassariella vexata]
MSLSVTSHWEGPKTTTWKPAKGTNGDHTNGAKEVAKEASKVPVARFLPPGFTTEKFQDFASRLQAIVSRENLFVVTEDTALEDGDYLTIDCQTHDMHFLYEREEFVGSALVHPRNVSEVQEIVRLCNEFVMPVWSISRGHNIGYGGAAPRVSGSLVMHMGTHMNKILEVDAENCFCLVEPGVTFLQMQEYLIKHNLIDKVWIDAPELGFGSMIGNALDRGVGFTPYGDHWMNHCGMEIVLANGELVRTGMGAMSSPEGRKQAKAGVPPQDQTPNECWQLFNYGFGPYNDGIFSQSNNGIVTKMGMWMMPNPHGYTPFMVTYEKDSDLPAVIDIIRPLRVNMVLQNAASLRHVALDAAHYHPRTEYTDDTFDVPLTEEQLDAAAKKLDLGRWIYMGAVYGPEPVRKALLEVTKKEMCKVPGSRWFLLEDRKEEFSTLHSRAETMMGIPNWDELRWLKHWIPNCTFLSFSPISKVDGQSAWKQYQMAKNRFAEAKLDFFGIFSIGLREMHNVICIVYNREDAAMRKRVQWLVRTLIQDCADNGWGEFRTHVGLMDQIADTYDFNGHALMKLNETIKNALDPKGILAPGKSGVWPKSYDRSKWALGQDYIK